MRLEAVSFGSMLFLKILLTGLLLQQAGPAINDGDFWRMVSDFSEAGGVFQAEYMSNEDSSQFVIPALQQTTRPGGVYVGVGC